jgi:hypothetical protein
MVVVHPSGSFAYAANVDCGTVSKIDLTTRQVATTAAAGDGVEGLALTSDGRLWTAANADGTVRVLDVEALVTLATIDVGGMAIRVEFVESHGLALVTSAAAGRITAIDLRTFEVQREISARWHSTSRSGRFLADPRAVLAEHGLEPLAHLEVKMVENTDDTVHITLPASQSDGDLSDEELSAAAGGAFANMVNGQCNDTCGAGNLWCDISF